MAIQFHCPYCTASIRVPDSAAGKQGTCPKCATKLIVPKVGPPTESSGTTAPPSGPVPSPTDLPDIQPEPPLIAEGPSIAHGIRRRRKRKGTNPLVPIVLFGVVLGVLVYWMWTPGVQLEGRLSAERVSDFSIPPGRIDKSAFNLPAGELGPTLEEMKRHPPAGVLVPDWFEMVFRPDDQGLEVRIRKTSATEVFRVKTSSEPAIRQFIKQHAEEIFSRQHAEFDSAIQRFLQDWRTSRKNELPFQTDSYRDSVGFNRLAGLTGYCIVAQIGSRSYRCVHEDDRGDLYFLLPRTTEQFVLTGRELPGGKTIFSGRFTVEVSKPPSDPEPADLTEPDEPDPSTDPNAEPRDEG